MQGLVSWFACLDLKARSLLLWVCVCLRAKARRLVFCPARLPFAQIQLCLRAESGELVVLLHAGKLCTRFVWELFNLSLILAMGYGWELKLSAKVFSISTFIKDFPCCVHIYLPPSPPPFFSFFFSCVTASDMKKDIETLITQEKAEIVAKYEKVPTSCFSPTYWLGLKLFN